MEKYWILYIFIILIPTPDFPHFYYMLGGNLGSLLYRAVSVMWVSANSTGRDFDITLVDMFKIEPRCEKTGLRGSRPGPTQT